MKRYWSRIYNEVYTKRYWSHIYNEVYTKRYWSHIYNDVYTKHYWSLIYNSYIWNVTDPVFLMCIHVQKQFWYALHSRSVYEEVFCVDRECNELCNHASNIWFIYIRLSILSYFMLNLTGHYSSSIQSSYKRGGSGGIK